MTVSYINLMRVQQKRHDAPLRPVRNYGSTAELQAAHAAARERLWNRPGARPGANLPRTSSVPFRSTEREAVDFDFAMGLVCEDQQVTPDQMMCSSYSAAVAARHMLWTVLLDGGHPVANIARIFGADQQTIRNGISTFRDFQKGKLG